MTWLSQTTLLGIVLGYLVFLFAVATLGEAFASRLGSGRIRTLTYVLAASVYCTAWTFYGSVGLAANRGLEFLTIYLGPACVALLWPVFLRKLVRVSKDQRITSISDFIASRYGKSAALGSLVAILVVCGMIPYIALQLKAVSASFKMIAREGSVLDVFDPTLLVAITLALFGILFGARNLDFTKQQTGLMTAVAVESVVKLLAFLLVGVYVTWGLFGGFGDLFGRIAAPPGLVASARPRPAGDRLLRAVDGDARDLDDGGHVPAAAVPRARGPEPARARRQLRSRGRSRSTCSSSTCSCCPSPSPGCSSFPEAGAEADGFILALPAALRQPPHLGGGVPRGLLGGDRDDRGGLPRPVQDDHQRHHPARAAAAARHRGHLLDHASFYTRLAHARRWSRLGFAVGAHGGAASSCWSRWGSCPSSRWRSARPPSCSGSTGGAGNRKGALTGISAGFVVVVLHADHPRPGQGRRARRRRS